MILQAFLAFDTSLDRVMLSILRLQTFRLSRALFVFDVKIATFETRKPLSTAVFFARKGSTKLPANVVFFHREKIYDALN